jgi:hypothetical protein
MRKLITSLCVVCATATAADAPAPSADKAGLDLIQARYAGTWTVAETAYAPDFSRPGTKQYDITRDCVPTGTVLDCKLMAQGVQQGEQRFSWDAKAGSYRVDMDIGGHPQPVLSLTVKDAAWTFLQEVPGPDGKPIQLRIQRQYRSPSEVSYSVNYSRDGVHWTLMSKGTEVRRDETTAKPAP